MSEIRRMEEQLRQKAMAAPLPMQGNMKAETVNLPMQAENVNMSMQKNMTAEEVALPMREGQKKMNTERIRKANEILTKYKNGKSKLENKIVANEKWWEGRAWDEMQSGGIPMAAKRPTMWLFNVIMGKHADMVESYPEPAIVAREEADQKTAQTLTSILPVILEQNGYDETYDDLAWEKNKQGTSVTAVYWDKTKLNNLGDITIPQVDMLNLFWEPGVSDIQKSKHVFYVNMADKEDLVGQYPELEGKNLTGGITLSKYEYEESVDLSDKALVVDWYYHKFVNGRKTLQYCKYVNEYVLYASEDDANAYENGYYEDGDYPFIVDALFPVKGTIAGKGYIDIGKGAQETIDLLDQACVMNAMAGAIPRYMTTDDSGLNEAEFLDFTKPFVHVAGSLTDNRFRAIDPPNLSGVHAQMLQNKIEELKQTTGNQDVQNGASGGVTAASAIAALQESAGRSSKDGIRGTWRAYARMIKMVISRMAQFYDAPRTFRILGENNREEFVEFSNGALKPTPFQAGEFQGMRVPEFDVSVSAQKQNAYSKMATNELALQLLNAGVFNPQMADQSMMLLSMMDFPRRDELMHKVQEKGMMLQQLAMWQQMALQLAAKYEPETAEEMALGVMGEAGMPVQNTQAPALTEGEKESGITEKARARSAQASQPE